MHRKAKGTSSGKATRAAYVSNNSECVIRTLKTEAAGFVMLL
jgi:hypothetical protein